MFDVQVFFYDGKRIRVVNKDGAAWFVLTDICRILGFNHNNTTAIIKSLLPQECSKFQLGHFKTLVNAINESGLYALIMRSSKPKAVEFRFKVTNEILPAVIRTGTYKGSVIELPAHTSDLKTSTKSAEVQIALPVTQLGTKLERVRDLLNDLIEELKTF